MIGLSLALELRSRGYDVLICDKGAPLAQASTAAAGMLAVHDPHNPRQLLALSELSGSLYPEFLSRIERLTGIAVPFQTELTWQTMLDGSIEQLDERSIDPQQLAPALLTAAQAAGVCMQEHFPNESPNPHALRPRLAEVHTTGSWSLLGLPVVPRKGQMLRVRLPSGSRINEVHRSERVYVVPRTKGSQAGTALIGATVEDAGYDTSTTPAALARLREMGATLVPEIADTSTAPAVEAWAGLRPTTFDGLPILGRVTPPHGAHSSGVPCFAATGHFRNGILLAPATAAVMVDLLEDRISSVDLEPFSATRFARDFA